MCYILLLATGVHSLAELLIPRILSVKELHIMYVCLGLDSSRNENTPI